MFSPLPELHTTMPTKDNSITWLRRYTCYDSYGFAPAAGTKYKFFGTSRKLLRTLNGVTNPRWKAQVAAKQNATTAMDATYQSVEVRTGFFRVNYQYLYDGSNRITRDTWVKGDMFHGTFSDYTGGSWTADAEMAAREKLYKQVRATQRSISGSTFAGELRETLKMVRNPAEALRKRVGETWGRIHELSKTRGVNRRAQDNSRASKKAKRSYERKLKDFVKDVSSSWLEWSFGWAPLINDLEDARKAADDFLETDRGILCSSGGRVMKDKGSGKASLGPLVTGTQIYYTLVTEDKEYAVYRYRAFVKAQAQSSWRGAAERFGFTPQDFIPTAWELLPWSFLIDYFTNVGDCLEAYTTDMTSVSWIHGVSITGRKTKKWTSLDRPTIEAVIGGKKYLNFYEESFTPYQVYHHKRVVRTPVISGFSPPWLRFKFPPFDSSAGKWLNITALLGQALDVHPQDVTRANYKKWTRA